MYILSLNFNESRSINLAISKGEGVTLALSHFVLYLTCLQGVWGFLGGLVNLLALQVLYKDNSPSHGNFAPS